MSGAEESGNKPKLTEEGPHLAPIIPHSEFWFKDGSVVLQAENTQFKVHQSILSANSVVFSDMFLAPQPAGEPLVEGCPIVHLSDTSADVTIMLQAICQRRHVANGSTLPISVVAAFLRLGNKYDIEVLRIDALKRIFYEIPSDLDKAAERTGWSTIYRDDDFTTLEMLNLAREQNLLSTLPILRYRCCRLTQFIKTDLFKTRLDPQEAIICATTSSTLIRLQGETTFSWMTFPPSKYDGCQASAGCSAARIKLAIKTFFPVALIALHIWQTGWERGMCKVCIDVASVEHENGRRRFWEALPGIFGLPGWEELNKERDPQIRLQGAQKFPQVDEQI
ncbi:hypothetical protein FIBSPDRAFT_837622 [Athelia psychrophila]|uniref:BTB domain-containing protein n=1 Tax=Athelia psychrophila TaxID=1759441 RepID=A0A166ABZ3_9AGAM|nr:hypothetical protein FIBSPDRAFT_837622 [Fibularhizoctonia sp. CBS 109695]